jgi:hypothetical protein
VSHERKNLSYDSDVLIAIFGGSIFIVAKAKKETTLNAIAGKYRHGVNATCCAYGRLQPLAVI